MPTNQLAYELWNLLRQTPSDVEVSREWATEELRCSGEELSKAARVVLEAMDYAQKEAASRQEPPVSRLPEPSKEMRDLFAFA